MPVNGVSISSGGGASGAVSAATKAVSRPASRGWGISSYVKGKVWDAVSSVTPSWMWSQGDVAGAKEVSAAKQAMLQAEVIQPRLDQRVTSGAGRLRELSFGPQPPKGGSVDISGVIPAHEPGSRDGVASSSDVPLAAQEQSQLAIKEIPDHARDDKKVGDGGLRQRRSDTTPAPIDLTPVKVGGEFLVNTVTHSSQHQGRATYLGVGKFVVMWGGDNKDERDVYAQVLKLLNRNALGKQGTEFRVNTGSIGAQMFHRIAALDADRFVAVWQGHDTTKSSWEIFGQMFTVSSGETLQRQGPEFRINREVNGYQQYPDITAFSPTQFVVTWSSSDGSGHGIYGQLYVVQGEMSPQRQGNQFQINSYTINSQEFPKPVAVGSQSLAVVWQSTDQDSSLLGIYGQIFKIGTGMPEKQGTEFRVNTYTINDQSDPSITLLGSDRVIVTWVSNGQDGSGYGIYGQVFEIGMGTPIKQGTEFQINTYTDSWQTKPSIIALGSNQMVVVWHSLGQDDSSFGIYGQMFEVGTGTPVKQGEEFRVNTYIKGEQGWPCIVAGDNGQFLVAWQSENQVAQDSGFDIYAQLFQAIQPELQTPIPPQTASIGQPFRYVIPDDTFGYTDNRTATDVELSVCQEGGDPLPDWIRFDCVQREFIVLADGLDQLGDHAFIVTATDRYGQSATASLTLNVQESVSQRAFCDAYDQGPVQKVGDEFLVNTNTLGNQHTLLSNEVAYLGNGKYVVTWNDRESHDGSSWGVFGQIYEFRDGKLEKQGVEFQVNTYTINNQSGTSVATLDGNRFVVSWHSSHGRDGSDWGVYGQVFQVESGTPRKQGDEFQINTHIADDQSQSSIAAVTADKVMVTWHSLNQDSSGYGVYGQVFKVEDGTPVKQGAEFQVNTHTSDDQQYPRITMLKKGKVIVTWHSLKQDGSDWGVYGQVFVVRNGTAEKQGDEFQINTYDTGSQHNPSIASIGGDRVVVTWISLNQDGSAEGIYGQMFRVGGGTPERQGTEFQVNTYTAGRQYEPSVTAIGSDRIVVVWDSLGRDNSEEGIYAQTFKVGEQTPEKQGVEFQVNSHTMGRQNRPGIVASDNGQFMVTWQSENQFASDSGFDIYAQLFQFNSPPKALAPLPPQQLELNQFFRIPIPECSFESQVQGADTALTLSAGRPFDKPLPDWMYFDPEKHELVGMPTNVSLIGTQQTIQIMARDVFGQQASQLMTLDINALPGLPPFLRQVGAEFLVNSYVAHNQKLGWVGSVTYLGKDKIVVTWASENQDGFGDGVYGQVFKISKGVAKRQGREFRLSTTVVGRQVDPSVSTIGTDTIVTGWTSWRNSKDYFIYARIFQVGEDTPKSMSGEIRISETDSKQDRLTTTPFGENRLLMSWQGLNQDGSSWGAFGQIVELELNGLKRIGAEFQLNSYTNDVQGHPVIAALDDRKFVSVWFSVGQDGSNSGVYGQAFQMRDDAPVRMGQEFQVNTYESGNQNVPVVAGLGKNRFVMAWQSDGQDGSSWGVYVRLYEIVSGAPVEVGSEFLVNTHTRGSQAHPSIAVLDTKILVSWNSQGQDGSEDGMYGQMIDTANKTLTKLGPEFRINTHTIGKQYWSSVASGDDGQFIVTWQSQNQAALDSGFDIYAQAFEFMPDRISVPGNISTPAVPTRTLPAITRPTTQSVSSQIPTTVPITSKTTIKTTQVRSTTRPQTSSTLADSTPQPEQCTCPPIPEPEPCPTTADPTTCEPCEEAKLCTTMTPVINPTVNEIPDHVRDDTGGGHSTGMLAGVVAGTAVGAAIVAGGIGYCVGKRGKREQVQLTGAEHIPMQANPMRAGLDGVNPSEHGASVWDEAQYDVGSGRGRAGRDASWNPELYETRLARPAPQASFQNYVRADDAGGSSGASLPVYEDVDYETGGGRRPVYGPSSGRPAVGHTRMTVRRKDGGSKV